MKYLFSLFIALTITIAAFPQSNSGNESVLVAKARAEVQSTCLTGYGGISSSVYQNMDGNFVVYFFQMLYNCPQNQICPLYLRIAPLSVVILDQNYNVIESRCWFSIFELQ